MGRKRLFLWTDFYTITPVYVVHVVANNKLRKLGTIGFRQSGLRKNWLARDMEDQHWFPCAFRGPFISQANILNLLCYHTFLTLDYTFSAIPCVFPSSEIILYKKSNPPQDSRVHSASEYLRDAVYLKRLQTLRSKCMENRTERDINYNKPVGVETIYCT